jgi:L-fuconolactonase
VANPIFIEGLKLLREADLTLDTANPRPDLIEAILRVNDKVPGLRIVLDHLPSMMAGLNAGASDAVDGNLRDLAQRPTIYIKVSEVLRIADSKPLTEAAVYKPALDHLFETFGENKLIFGSDWPNGPAVNNLAAIVGIVRGYFLAKGAATAEKYFLRHSAAAYKWKPRDPTQRFA